MTPPIVTDTLAAFRRRIAKPKEVVIPWATRDIAGALQFTSNGLFVWFVLDGQAWDFRTLGERLQLWDQQAFRFGALAQTRPEGLPIRLRVTTRPYPAFEYARSLDEDTPSPLPHVAGGETWDEYLGHAQRRLQQTGLDQKVVALGVFLAPHPTPSVKKELIEGTEEPSKETKTIVEALNQLVEIVKGQGFGGRLANHKDMAFLMHRSLSMGTPVPAQAGVGGERWEVEDLAEFYDRRTWNVVPNARSVQVLSEQNGEPVERHVSVLTMGVMPDLTFPEVGEPWMITANRQGFPVEWSVNGTLLTAQSLRGAIKFERDRAIDVAKHYDEHGIIMPDAVGKAVNGATDNLNEVEEGDSRTAGRFLGTVRCAVYANTEDEARDRARKLIDIYGQQLNMPLIHTKGQAEALREFVPGEARNPHGYQRRFGVKYFASAMANVDSELGTPTGPYLGYGIGSARRASRFGMHYGPEELNAPGLFTIVAEPGAGKSVLIGTLAFNAVHAGEPTIILDPSGPLARLATLPEFAPHSRVIDLTEGKAGTLSPYQLIPEPTRSAFLENGKLDEINYERAVRRAAAERQQLMFDVLRMWLPPSTLRLAGTDVMLRDALRRVAERARKSNTADTAINPRWILNALHTIEKDAATAAQAELARQLIEEIRAAAEFPLGELIMPPDEKPIPHIDIDDKTLVIVTMPGIDPPPEGVEREFWGSTERYTQPLLHLAAFFTSKFIYGRDRNTRKNVFLDENHLMAQWGSGRALFVRLSRDSRKWNTAVGAASQHPADHLGIGRIDALIGSSFVGRLTKADVAVEACKLLECPAEYANVIMALSSKPQEGSAGAGQTGEFVWRDPLGRLGKFRVDLDWHPALREVLQTTPGRRRADVDLTPQPTPFIDPALFDDIDIIPINEAEQVAA